MQVVALSHISTREVTSLHVNHSGHALVPFVWTSSTSYFSEYTFAATGEAFGRQQSEKAGCKQHQTGNTSKGAPCRAVSTFYPQDLQNPKTNYVLNNKEFKTYDVIESQWKLLNVIAVETARARIQGLQDSRASELLRLICTHVTFVVLAIQQHVLTLQHLQQPREASNKKLISFDPDLKYEEHRETGDWYNPLGQQLYICQSTQQAELPKSQPLTNPSCSSRCNTSGP